MADLSSIETALSSIQASEQTLAVLRDLHTQALTEPAYLSTDSQPATAALERFVALEPDKCAFVYALLRGSGARHVVEAGTSFGVSTVYLALAVGQNAAALAGGEGGKVIATENEAVKAARARRHWAAAGPEVERWIELREGDLRETLKSDLPDQVDFLLLDIWSPLALPTLQLVRPKLRQGAAVLIDNVSDAKAGYVDFVAFLSNPSNGFVYTVLPYKGGLGLATYVGSRS